MLDESPEFTVGRLGLKAAEGRDPRSRKSIRDAPMEIIGVNAMRSSPAAADMLGPGTLIGCEERSLPPGAEPTVATRAALLGTGMVRLCSPQVLVGCEVNNKTPLPPCFL